MLHQNRRKPHEPHDPGPPGKECEGKKDQDADKVNYFVVLSPEHLRQEQRLRHDRPRFIGWHDFLSEELREYAINAWDPDPFVNSA